ncbi:MAG: AAA family ATPase [Niameybacter sp.]
METRLKDVFKYPLTVITAPLGYGKTVLVREFLKDQKADVFWAALDEGDRDKGYFVRRFISLLREGNEESAPGLEQVIEFIKEAAATRSYVLVLDGYEHVAEMDWMNNLIKELIKEPIYHFHIIVISRTMPYMNIEELRMKRVCQVLDEGDLRFDLQEVEEYLRINGLEGKIHPEEAYESSDGWIGAMTLMKEHKGIYGMVQEIYQLGDLLEEEILQKYDHLERDLLIVAAHLDEFKIKDLGEFGVDINSATKCIYSV